MGDLWSKTELKKCGLRQSKDGVIISFVLHPDDVSRELVNAKIGTRYLAALVEITEEGAGDANVEKKMEMEIRAETTERKPLNLTQQAAIMCNDPRFKRFVDEVKPDAVRRACEAETGTEWPVDMWPSDKIVEAVRLLCGVESRAEFQRDEAAGSRWKALYSEYAAWVLTQ
jgi:hypothetical protein